MKFDEQQLPTQSKAAKFRFDGYLSSARIGVPLGVVPVLGYWLAFSAFKASCLPWQIALAIEIISPATIYVHHYLNRYTRRLIWAGAAMSVGVLPMWLLFGSYWLFYFGFAPMQAWIRAISLTLSLFITTCWAWLTWRSFAREMKTPEFTARVYQEEETRIIYSIDSDRVTAMLETPSSSIVLPAGLVSTLGPLILAYTIVSGHTSDSTAGPHGVFIILSILSVPLTGWLLSSFFVRFAYFYIYFPLKLERSTGKKVILEA